MAVIMRDGELLPLKVGDVTFYLAPLTQPQKVLVYKDCTTRSGGEENLDSKKFSEMIIRYSVKRVDGVFDIYGDEVEFEYKDGVLTEDSYQLLYQLNRVDRLVVAAQHLFSGEIAKIKKLEGVELVLPKRKRAKKKK